MNYQIIDDAQIAEDGVLIDCSPCLQLLLLLSRFNTLQSPPISYIKSTLSIISLLPSPLSPLLYSMEASQIDNANQALQQSPIHQHRCTIFLHYFNQNTIAQKLSTHGLTNLDLMSHVLYAPGGGIFEDEDYKSEQKKELRQRLLQILTKKEYTTLCYLLQYYEYDETILFNSLQQNQPDTQQLPNLSQSMDSSVVPLRDDADLDSILEGLQALQL